MEFLPTPLPGTWIIELRRHHDERGFFARTFCEQDFGDRGLCVRYRQASISFNHHRATLRGMHFQAQPHMEAKLIRCSQGAMYDVALDVRPESPTYLQWTAVELTASNGRLFYLPAGCAHGFLTLEDNTEVSYQISEDYHPELARGFRWNDKAFGIRWPIEPVVMSTRDRNYPDFVPEIATL